MTGSELRSLTRCVGITLALSVLVLASAPAAQEMPGTTTLVLANATLIDGAGAAPRPDVTLVIDNGVIVEIVDGALPATRADAEVVDLTGRFILPGLIDSHVHLSNNPDAEAALRGLLDAGVTTVRDMGGDARTLAVLARDATIGAIHAPHVYYSALLFGPPFLQDARSRFASRGMEPGRAPWARTLTADGDLPQIIAEARGTGATGLKLYSALEPTLVERVVREAHRQGLKVWSHATIFPSRPSDAVAAGVDVLSHSSGLYPEARPDVPSSYTDAITTWFPEQDFTAVDPAAPPFDGLFASMVDSGAILEPTVAAVLQPRSGAGRQGRQEHLARAAQRMDMSARREWTCAVTRAAHEAGVTIAAGTDSNGSTHVRREMEGLAECGLSPLEAIRAATLHGARAIGIEATHGSLEVGKVADLAILAADPLADIGNVREVVAVMKSGRWHRRDGGVEVRTSH